MYQFVAVLDARGTLLEVNRAALEGAGLKLSDVEGKPFWQCFWWAVSTEIQENLKAAILRAAQVGVLPRDLALVGLLLGDVAPLGHDEHHARPRPSPGSSRSR